MNLKNSKQIDGGFCGSPIAMAPEVAKRNAQYGPQCDIWSVGCMTYELLCGHPPFTARSKQELFRIVQQAQGPDFQQPVWATVLPDGKYLVSQMLKKLPEERPSAAEALRYNWF